MIVNRHGERVLTGLHCARSEFENMVATHGLTDLDIVLLACKSVGVAHSRIARALKKNKGTISRQIRTARSRVNSHTAHHATR